MKKKVKCAYCGKMYWDGCYPDISFCCGSKKCIKASIADFKSSINASWTMPAKSLDNLVKSALKSQLERILAKTECLNSDRDIRRTLKAEYLKINES